MLLGFGWFFANLCSFFFFKTSSLGEVEPQPFPWDLGTFVSPRIMVSGEAASFSRPVADLLHTTAAR